jgi:CheY-like chemotaxis protein
MTIFYVDDDLDDRELLSEVLKEIDPTISCVTACDGRDALDTLAARDLVPDYILLDINMPKMNGRKCLEELKKDERYSNIPVIMYSTTRDPREINSYFQMGAHSFLRKPTSYQQLYSTMSIFLKSVRGGK